MKVCSHQSLPEYPEFSSPTAAIRLTNVTMGTDPPHPLHEADVRFPWNRRMTETEHDHRAYPRFIHRTSVGIAVLEILDRTKGGRIQGASCRDLSRGGMRIRTERELSGVELRIKFLLPDGLDQTIDATAVRVEPIDRENFEYGLEFHTLLPADSFDGEG